MGCACSAPRTVEEARRGRDGGAQVHVRTCITTNEPLAGPPRCCTIITADASVGHAIAPLILLCKSACAGTVPSFRGAGPCLLQGSGGVLGKSSSPSAVGLNALARKEAGKETQPGSHNARGYRMAAAAGASASGTLLALPSPAGGNDAAAKQDLDKCHRGPVAASQNTGSRQSTADTSGHLELYRLSSESSLDAKDPEDLVAPVDGLPPVPAPFVTAGEAAPTPSCPSPDDAAMPQNQLQGGTPHGHQLRNATSDDGKGTPCGENIGLVAIRPEAGTLPVANGSGSPRVDAGNGQQPCELAGKQLPLLLPQLQRVSPVQDAEATAPVAAMSAAVAPSVLDDGAWSERTDLDASAPRSVRCQ